MNKTNITLLFLSIFLLLTTSVFAQESIEGDIKLIDDKKLEYFELSKTYDATKYQDTKIKDKLELYNELNTVVNKEITKDQAKITYEKVDLTKTLKTDKGAVTNPDGLENIKNYSIKDRTIRIEYDQKVNLTNNYSISMYVGTNNKTYSIYYHPNPNASIKEILQRREIVMYVTSVNGYLNYESKNFSVQYASFIDADMEYNDFYSVDLKNIFDPGFWEYANVDFTNPDTSSSVTLQAKRDLTTQSHTNSYFTIRLVPTFIGGLIVDTVVLEID